MPFLPNQITKRAISKEAYWKNFKTGKKSKLRVIFSFVDQNQKKISWWLIDVNLIGTQNALNDIPCNSTTTRNPSSSAAAVLPSLSMDPMDENPSSKESVKRILEQILKDIPLGPHSFLPICTISWSHWSFFSNFKKKKRNFKIFFQSLAQGMRNWTYVESVQLPCLASVG